MFEGLSYLGQGIASILTPLSIFNVAWATLLGITIGILPGLTATMGVALLVTFTYPMPPDQAILTLMCVYIGAIYGGSRTAILLNIPGTPASAATTLDGYPLARQGKAGLAMGLATTSSALGTLVGVFFLALLAPLLGEAALKFGSYEFFWLGLFGVLISGQMTGVRQPAQGLHRRHPRPPRRDDRHGEPARLPALHLRHAGARRRRRPDPGDGRRLRPRRDPRRDEAARRGAGSSRSTTGWCRPSARSSSTGAPSSARASSAPSSASSPASARTSAPGPPTPRPSASASTPRSSARAARRG